MQPEVSGTGTCGWRQGYRYVRLAGPWDLARAAGGQWYRYVRLAAGVPVRAAGGSGGPSAYSRRSVVPVRAAGGRGTGTCSWRVRGT